LLVLAARDTVDFTVGYGSNGAFHSDSTGIDVTITRPDCGHGVLDPGEECDDGNTSDNDACRNDCRFNVCGDGFRDPATEQCDDGNADLTVTIDELITVVNLALNGFGESSCAAGDANGDGVISISEIIGAVNSALVGCSSP
jgi:cysteine-rich repeat protein